MSNPLIGPEEPIGRLLAEGYDLKLQTGHLIIDRVPYLTADGPRADGRLVLPVNDSGGVITDAIGDHTIWFSGNEPRDERGAPLGGASPRDLGKAGSVNFMLSFKPPGGSYPSLYEKVRSYARILSIPAREVDSTLTTTPGAAFQAVEDDLPLVYRDTNSTRAGLTPLNNVFRGHRIAVIGVGGSGSYILDQVAKTWVDCIDLFDGDVFENHNAFRAPGAAALETLQARRNKAEYFAEEYSRMHTGITAHPEHLTMSNIDLLANTTFVFLAAADADQRPLIMTWLSEHDIPFVDVGMGLHQEDGGLTGLVRSTMYLPDNHITSPVNPPATPGQDDYGTNIQVADLNALNALLAVISWKRHLGFYATHTPAAETIYKLFLNELRNGDTT
ncbi:MULTISPECIES: ThiF family adenylyltransferase [unclassified Mycobacterium]|uniref:ThiF family adenylyltransferase n=1 Tax=unclassified Mycobacterium TaxID=2642494 RepID=UPI003875D44C